MVVWIARLLLSGGLSSFKSWVFFLVPWLHRRITGGRVSLLLSMSCSHGVKGPFLIVGKLLLLMHWLYLESGMSRPWFTCPLVLHELNQLVFKFFWSGKCDLVACRVVVQPTSCGGFSVLDVGLKVWALLLQWVRRLAVSPSTWVSFFSF